MSTSLATLETRVKCVVSDLDVISKQVSDSRISLTKTKLFIIMINTAVL